MVINLYDTVWEINNGEYFIGEGENFAYVVTDSESETVYQNDDFESCLVWCLNS